MIEDQYLRALQGKMDELAHNTLKVSLDAAKMAEAAGRYKGMLEAKNLFLKLLNGPEEQ